MAQEDKRGRDVALLYAPTDDGKGARILRARDGNIEAGEVRPAKDGQPLPGAELVRLEPRPDAPSICDVHVLHEARTRESTAPSSLPEVEPTGRPAQVATEGYRVNWDRVFGGRKESVTIHQDVLLYAGTFEANDATKLALSPGRKAWAQVVRGTISVNGTRLEEGDGAAVVDEHELDFTDAAAAELLVFDLP